MPYEVSTIKLDSEESTAGESHRHAKNSSIENQFSKPAKGKSVCSKGRQNIDISDKVGALRTKTLCGQAGPEKNMLYEQSAVLHSENLKGRSSLSSFEVYQKPRLKKKLNGDEELIKHMSHLPRYLQRREKEDNIQEKALNVGVLDWGLLERWAYHQKCTANGEQGQSTSSTSEFIPVPTCKPSNNLVTSKLSQTKVYSSYYPCRKPIIKSNATQLKEKANIAGVADFKTNNLSTNLSNLHGGRGNAECHLSTERSGHDNGIQHLESKDLSNTAMVTPCTTFLLSTLKKDDGTYSTNNSLGTGDGSPKRADKLQGNHHGLNLAGDVPKYLENSKFVQDPARENVEEKNIRTESSLWKGSWLVERNDKNLADMLFEDAMDMHRSTDVPHSCPLPQNTSTNPDTVNTSMFHVTFPTEKPKCQNSNPEHLRFQEPSFVCKSQKPPQYEAKATKIGGNPHNVPSTGAAKWMSRSSSLKESLIGELKLSAAPDKLEGDKLLKNNKSRQSPLRRMLDPLLNPKNHLQFSRRSAASPGRHSYEPSKSDKSLIWQEMGSTYGLHKSSITSNDSIFQAKVDKVISAEESNNCKRSLQVDKHDSSRRRALLQLAWKNGFPLFMLSSSDNDVLVATISPKRASCKDELECIYTIFFVNESRKKRMLWSNTGNKGKNDRLVSSVVGQIKVSTAQYKSNEFPGYHVMKEFVLIGSELVPKSTENVDFSYKSELAAIIVNVPQGRPIVSSIGALSNSSCMNSFPTILAKHDDEGKSLQTNKHSSSLDAPGISVILPSSVHGLSTDGGPSPLIHRWRSGGACDCGGWDEGCTLTILKGKSLEGSKFDESFQVCQRMDGSQRLELFVQGRPRENHPAFSIVSFKEGLYTIDFTSSIALVQAFAICIATLHAREPTKNPAELKSLHENLVNDQVVRTPARSLLRDATSYIPNCPPLSPVARA